MNQILKKGITDTVDETAHWNADKKVIEVSQWEWVADSEGDATPEHIDTRILSTVGEWLEYAK
jgi:hypothetical protein